MSRLATLQKTVQQALLDNHARDLAFWLKTDKQLARHQRLNIYQQAYTSRLLRCLREHFPKLHLLLGTDLFHALGEAYLRCHPSTTFTLRDLGSEFSTFIKQSALSAKDAMAALVDFECALLHAIDAKDEPSLSFEELQAIPQAHWPYLCFQFHPSLILWSSSWPMVGIWCKLDAAPKAALSLPSQTETQYWIIYRQHQRAQFRRLNTTETIMQKAMMGGACFAKACELLTYEIDLNLIPETSISIIRHWTAEGLITKGVVSQER